MINGQQYPNVVLVDHDPEESDDYLRGLNDSTDFDWHVISSVANKGRGTFAGAITRYVKYFLFPLRVFFNRKYFKNIIGWQAFYGINLAFFEKFFHVKKTHTLVIQHFIYKRKNGVLGKLYDWYIHYAIDEKYIDLIITCSSGYVDELVTEFGLKGSTVKFVPFGVLDYQKQGIVPSKGNYALSLGRSNRDWDWLIKEAASSPINLIIACDTLHRDNLPSNVRIRNDVNGEESLRLLAGCFCSIIPIDDPRLSSGETVLLQSMCFGKPLIVTSPSGLASDYVRNGINGFAIEKARSQQLAQKLTQINNNVGEYDSLSSGSRSEYESKYSLVAHGKNVGKAIAPLINTYDCGDFNE